MHARKSSRSRVERRTSLLSRFAELTAVSTSRDDLLRRFVRWTIRSLGGTDGLAVYFHDASSDHLVPVAWYGLEEEPFRKVRLSPGEGISGLAFERRMRFAIENQEEPNAVHLFGEGLSLENERYLEEAQGCILPRAIASFPLQSRHARRSPEVPPFGVLSVWRYQEPLDPEMLDLLDAVISPLTLALSRVTSNGSNGRHGSE